jgi:hypothetical protein
MLNQFEECTISVPLKPSESNSAVRVLSLFRRNVHQLLLDLLSDPLYISNVEWVPQRHFKSSGDGWMRFISQPWTADEFWELWVRKLSKFIAMCFTILSNYRVNFLTKRMEPLQFSWYSLCTRINHNSLVLEQSRHIR